MLVFFFLRSSLKTITLDCSEYGCFRNSTSGSESGSGSEDSSAEEDTDGEPSNGKRRWETPIVFTFLSFLNLSFFPYPYLHFLCFFPVFGSFPFFCLSFFPFYLVVRSRLSFLYFLTYLICRHTVQRYSHLPQIYQNPSASSGQTKNS